MLMQPYCQQNKYLPDFHQTKALKTLSLADQMIQMFILAVKKLGNHLPNSN